MEFIINHVRQFDHVHDTNRNAVVEWFSCSSIVKNRFGITSHTCFFDSIPNIFFPRTVKYRCCYMDTKFSGSHTEVKRRYR